MTADRLHVLRAVPITSTGPDFTAADLAGMVRAWKERDTPVAIMQGSHDAAFRWACPLLGYANALLVSGNFLLADLHLWSRGFRAIEKGRLTGLSIGYRRYPDGGYLIHHIALSGPKRQPACRDLPSLQAALAAQGERNIHA